MATVTYSTVELDNPSTINTFTSGTQYSPDALGLSNGNSVVAYNTVGSFILVDFYDPDHNPIGSYRIPYLSGTVGTGQPSLTQLSNGNVAVVWLDGQSGDEGIKLTIYDQNGFQVSASEIDAGNSVSAGFGVPTVTALANGNMVVAAEFGGNIFQTLLSPSGSTLSFYAQSNTTTPGTQNDAQVTALAGGGYAVTWTDTNPSDQTIMGRIYDVNGVAIAANDFTIASFGDNTQSSVAALQNGGFAVAYTDSGWLEGGTLGNGISLQIVSATGALGALVHVNATTTSDEVDPDVTVLSNGFIVVSWTHVFSSTDNDIYGAVFDQAGNRILINGASEFTIEGDGNNEIHGAIARLLDGQFLTTWENTTNGDIGGSVRELVRTTVGDGTAETLTGDSLRDIIHGGGGADTITGGTARDQLFGEEGNDLIRITQAQTATGIVYDGGADSDTLNVAGSGTYFYDLTDDSVLSIESITFSDPGLSGHATVQLNASQFGGTGISLFSTFSGVSFGDVTDTLDITLDGAINSFSLAGMNFVNFNGLLDHVILRGDSDAETITGGNGNDSILGNGGGDSLSGGGGTDYLSSSSGANTLNGGAGADTMQGGSGNDIFYVDDVNDVVKDSAGGIDEVRATASFSLYGSYAENVVLQGSGDINATGNAKDNILTGNSGANVLDGKTGADTMIGGLGNDTYYVDNAGDVVTETNGTGSGNDTVNSTISYSLAGKFVENLTLLGTATSATGNSLSNILTGNSAANILNGGSGVDTMAGGLGNDTYYVDNPGDKVIEANGTNTGIDTVNSAVTFNLTGQYIENLTLTGTGDINATGNSLDNTLIGNTGDNVLLGGIGNDTMTGGAGADTFMFASAISAANLDHITNFVHGTDKIGLDKTYFSKLFVGSLSAASFKDISTGTVDSNDRILYNHSTGQLYYDADGSGSGAAKLFGVVDNHATITASDFIIVA